MSGNDKDLILIVLVLILGLLFVKFLKPKLQNKIKDMESELQKRKQ